MEQLLSQDRYAAAVCSSDLTPYPRSVFAPVDVLTAAGMAAQRQGLGMLLQRVRADSGSGDGSVDRSVCEVLLARRLREAVRRRVVRREGVDAAVVVSDVMAWWLAPTCPDCGGVKREVQYKRLTGPCCKACGGSGVRPMRSQAPDAAGWVLECLTQQVERSEGALRRVLR